tara:strand:+ start:53 stop:304 length:252 start_codon:yes stop_codon:yes gene_type:complete
MIIFFLKILIINFFLISSFSIADENQYHKFDDNIVNEKTYSGPMGMGLIRSYELKQKKICIYNTINGQKKIVLENKSSICPKK